LRHNVIGNEFLFVQQSKNPFSKGLIKSSDINLWKAYEYAILPVPIG